MSQRGFEFQRLVADPRISTSIVLPVMALRNALNLNDELKGKLTTSVIEVAKKLESVKYHADNAIRLIDTELTKEKEAWKDHPEVVRADLTTGVEKEVEAFIMQGKSTLDILVKIFEPLFGIKLHSYGNSGKDVVNILNRNLPKDEVKRSERLIEMIRQDKIWIEKWLKSERDTINHYRTLRSTGFREVFRNGETFVLAPATTSGVPLRDLVHILYENLLMFCEEFIVMALNIKLYPGFTIGFIPDEQINADFPVKFCVIAEDGTLPE